MAYSPLQPENGDGHVSPLVPLTVSRKRTFKRGPIQSMPPSSSDEVPLLDLPSSSSSTIKGSSNNLAPYVVGVDELGHVMSTVENSKEHIDSARFGQFSQRNSLRARFNSTFRYIRSSGPANQRNPYENTAESKRSRIPTGWRLGTWVCCTTVILCIFIETALLVYAYRKSNGTSSGVLMEGNCQKIREFELWLLLPLNVAGTMILGTSNYVMQVVSAPERKEIDEAHSFARCVAIGGMRFNDMTSVKGNKLRRSIWWVLGLSSLPIHFLLNVAVYSSVQASNTGIVVVSDDFDRDTGWTYCANLPSNRTSAESTTCSLYKRYMNNQTLSMTTAQCLRQYSNGFQTNASSVIVVTGQNSPRWYTIPQVARVPDSESYGAIHCTENFTVESYIETSDNLYDLNHDWSTNCTTISLGFIPFCENKTYYTENGTYLGSAIEPTSRSFGAQFSYTIQDELLLQEVDSLSNITSIKALFSAFQYRYWAVSSVSGDYLRTEFAGLLENRDPRAWLCPRDDLSRDHQCDPVALQRMEEWLITPNSMPVQECHVLPKKESCVLRYSSSILIITICFDIVKFLAMTAALTLISRPLMTLGDVIESFLRIPDPYSAGRVMLDDNMAVHWPREAREKVQNQFSEYMRVRFGRDFLERPDCTYCGQRLLSLRSVTAVDERVMTLHRECGKFPAGTPEMPYDGEQALFCLSKGGLWWTTVLTGARWQQPTVPERRRWFQVPSRSRWTWFMFFYLSALSLAIAYFAINFKSLLAQQLPNPWIVGFNAPDPNSLLTGGLAGATSIFTAALLINAPQIAFSMLYFIFNATLTMMHTAHEWDSFALHRKALRVTTPRGQQRATYWLQLPWVYSIPLIVISGSMHWLLSRSLYIVKVDVYGYLGEREEENDYFACGYSPIPALLLVFVLASMGAISCALAFRWLPGGMPLVRLNSLAIAAACHANPDEKSIELEPLMWGEIEGYTEHGKPHYSFSAKSVVPLECLPVPDWKLPVIEMIHEEVAVRNIVV